MSHEDALAALLGLLTHPGGSMRLAEYGYDLYLPRAAREYVYDTGNLKVQWGDPDHVEICTAFYEAVWELCRRGILRPGIRTWNTTAVSGGEGFCLTEYGRRWLNAHANTQVLPMQPRRFVQLLEPFQERFGRGFIARATEALRCYEAGLNLAACAMCGAAAESVLLAIALERSPEEEVLKTYAGRDGRHKLEKMVLAGQREHVGHSFRVYMDLLKYWRDEAAHGLESDISDDESFTSLMLVARLGSFVTDHFPTSPDRARG